MLKKYFINVFTTENITLIPEPIIVYERPNKLERIIFTLETIKLK